MSKAAFDQKLAALEELRTSADAPATSEALRRALGGRNNYIVSKAATVAGDLRLQALVPELLTAFDRFLTNPAKSDPQCWAKNAIAKALVDLGHTDADVFVKGLRHFQMEPVWGGQADTAAVLRATCTMALVNCRLDDLALLRHLVSALTDPNTRECPGKLVRIDAARAIAQLGAPEGALLLRLKALLGDPEPEVIGQCFASLLSLETVEAVGFIAQFLDPNNNLQPSEEIQLEAACALAQCDQAEGLVIVKNYWERWTVPEFKQAVLLSLGASPLRAATDFLLSLLSEASPQLAADAVRALAASRFRSEVRDQASHIIAGRGEDGRGDAAVSEIFRKEFPDTG
jgi:hypothetical protein